MSEIGNISSTIAHVTLLIQLKRRWLAGPDSEIYVSVASAWEIAIKYAVGRLALPQRPDHFVPVHRAKLGAELLPIDEESALHVIRLPDIHKDPFDRILVAQAQVEGITLVTADPMVAKYPGPIRLL